MSINDVFSHVRETILCDLNLHNNLSIIITI